MKIERDLIVLAEKAGDATGTSYARLRIDPENPRRLWLHVENSPYGLTKGDARRLAVALRKWAK